MEDKRTRYTKLVLKDSLIGLLQKKPISRITVTELCRTAELNRATYYAYYKDPYDQLQQIEQSFLDGIVRELSALPALTGDDVFLNVTERILQSIAENAALCRVLLGKTGSIDFQERITEFLRETVIALWKTKKPLDADTAEDLYCFVAAGSIGLVRNWLFTQAPLQDTRVLAARIVTLSGHGIQAFVG